MKTMLAAILLALSPFSSLGIKGQSNGVPIDISLLELQKNKDQYDNCRVRVHGEYLWGNGNRSIAFRDPRTKDVLVSIWLDFNDDIDILKEFRKLGMPDYMKLASSGELTNSLKSFEWVVPIFVKPSPAKQLEEIQKYMKKRHYRPAKIMVVGRFDYAQHGRLILRRNGEISFLTGFGAEARWPYRIVVETIEIQRN